MASTQFQADFAAWCDQALSGVIPADVIAFNFNLYEPWKIEVIGSDHFSDTDESWACRAKFGPITKRFLLPAKEVGSKWDAVLQTTKELIAVYLESSHSGAAKLRAAQHVTVGFVDGNLEKVWPQK